MADNSQPVDDVPSRTTTTVSPDRTDRDDPPTLSLSVVRYEERADRGTVHPEGLSGIERMETWLSADLSVFVDLDEWR